MSGRYTAYHVYQNLSFSEADRAATRPYRLPEYRCAHSQRGYLFQFDNMVERNHFDAATTTCCDEPVLNFQNKPQWTAAAKPMKPRDCSAGARVVGCDTLEVSIEDSTGMCASESARIRRIRIKCPSACPEFSEIRSGGIYKGRYGTFRSLGMEADEILILDYTPDQKSITDIYNGCSGTVTFTEEFCNGRTLSFEVRAGLAFPGDCGCDCCGEHGVFPGPDMIVSSPVMIDGGLQNQVGPGIVISGDPACRGGEITGVFHGTFGPTDVTWNGSTVYHSDGTDRHITRDLPTIGASDNPACCGGEIEWTLTDGCGHVKHKNTIVNSQITGSSVAPADGTVLYEADGYSFTGLGACAHSMSARLDLETVCLENGQSPLYRYDGSLVRNIDSIFSFTDSHSCSGCCGNGEVNLIFDNGCGSSITASYPVRRHLAATANSDVIGRIFKCERFFRAFTPIGYFYRVAVADLRCDGSFGDFTNPLPGYYEHIEDCVSLIYGPSAPALTGLTGCAALAGGDSCCFYSDNGLAGLEFISRVVSVSGQKCCEFETTNGSWVNGGTGDGCCPNNDGGEWG